MTFVIGQVIDHFPGKSPVANAFLTPAHFRELHLSQTATTACLVEFVQENRIRPPLRQPTFQEPVPILCPGACPMLTTKPTLPLDIDMPYALLLEQIQQGIV